MPGYMEEFPDFGEMDVAIPPGFADRSYRNETCPCFIDDDAGLFLFIDYADPQAREFPETPRFHLVEGTRHPVYGLQRDDANVEVALTDDWSEILAALEARSNPSPAAP